MISATMMMIQNIKFTVIENIQIRNFVLEIF